MSHDKRNAAAMLLKMDHQCPLLMEKGRESLGLEKTLYANPLSSCLKSDSCQFFFDLIINPSFSPMMLDILVFDCVYHHRKHERG